MTVLSEVGSKDADKIIPPYQWIELMQKELEAGAWKVIGEAREGGNVGLFRSSGEVRSGLVQEILTKIPFEKIIWEAPQKAQQVWFIKLLGANVNLGNIAPEEVIPLANRLRDISGNLRMWLEDPQRDQVYYIERRGRGCFLQATPIDVSHLLTEKLFTNVKCVVMTSATLAVAGGFEFTH